MATKKGHKVIGAITVLEEFHGRYVKPMDFIIENGEFMSALVGKITISEWNDIRAEFPNQDEYYDKYVPGKDD